MLFYFHKIYFATESGTYTFLSKPRHTVIFVYFCFNYDVRTTCMRLMHSVLKINVLNKEAFLIKTIIYIWNKNTYLTYYVITMSTYMMYFHLTTRGYLATNGEHLCLWLLFTIFYCKSQSSFGSNEISNVIYSLTCLV